MKKARPQIRIMLVTAPEKDAARIARKLLEERLIACANLLPRVRSIYRWKGKVESGTETLLILKTPVRHVRRLMKRVQSLHPYDVPEILSLQVDSGLSAYVQWVEAEC